MIQLRILLLPLLWVGMTRLAAAEEVSFRNDIMAVLSKSGCNAGTCHGNQTGKGGFRLSLRGENPQQDHLTLTHRVLNRRVNPLQPERSLILLKATMEIAHEGGKRFDVGSPEYEMLKTWMANGMPFEAKNEPLPVKLLVSPEEALVSEPESSIQLQVRALFSDDTERNLTSLAVYEVSNQGVNVTPAGLVQRNHFGEATVLVRYLHLQVPVRIAFLPARPEFTWEAPAPVNRIDELVFAKLRELKMKPSVVCDDPTFVRRAYLDLTGRIPTAQEARTFVESADPDKRRQLIDELLQRPEFADYWALLWSDLLRNEEKVLDRTGVKEFHGWIRESIASNKPLDQFARELITGVGSTYKHPPANYYRAMRDPFTRSESSAQLFLGVRLQCAKCHNHPFDRWTQDDYYGWANFFARIDYKIIENKRKDNNDGHEFIGEQIVFLKDEGNVTNPRTGKMAELRFLGNAQSHPDPEKNRLEQLADWLVSPENERFAQMQANRIWYQLFGRGIVEPLDDFRSTNPPVNPPLLAYLSEELVHSEYNMRHMIRLIMNSRVYQLSSVPNETNQSDEGHFSHAIPQRLKAEQLLDSFSQALKLPVEFNGYDQGIRATQIPGVMAFRPRDKAPSRGDQFLTLFGKPPRLQSCECERSNESTLSQSFTLLSGPLLNEMLTEPDNTLSEFTHHDEPPAELLTRLYWQFLSRPPTPEELEHLTAYLESKPDRRTAWEDIAWGLLTSSEFLLRR